MRRAVSLLPRIAGTLVAAAIWGVGAAQFGDGSRLAGTAIVLVSGLLLVLSWGGTPWLLFTGYSRLGQGGGPRLDDVSATGPSDPDPGPTPDLAALHERVSDALAEDIATGRAIVRLAPVKRNGPDAAITVEPGTRPQIDNPPAGVTVHPVPGGCELTLRPHHGGDTDAARLLLHTNHEPALSAVVGACARATVDGTARLRHAQHQAGGWLGLRARPVLVETLEFGDGPDAIERSRTVRYWTRADRPATVHWAPYPPPPNPAPTGHGLSTTERPPAVVLRADHPPDPS